VSICVQLEGRPTRELGSDAFCAEHSNFVRHPEGRKKMESNGERRARLTVEVWVKMDIFGQLCQGFHARTFAKGFQGLSKDNMYWLLRLSCLFLQGRIRMVGCYHEVD
jgi:hypothetical protein